MSLVVCHNLSVDDVVGSRLVRCFLIVGVDVFRLMVFVAGTLPLTLLLLALTADSETVFTVATQLFYSQI